MASASSSPGLRVHDDQAGRAGQAGLQLGEALPQVPAAEAGRREEEEQHRRGGLHHLDPAAERRRASTPTMSWGAWWGGRCRSGWGGAGAGSRPAARSRDLRRVRRARRARRRSISTTLRPWPHQRHTTSSTLAGEHLLVLDDEVAAHACSGGRPWSVLRDGDVEAGEVAAAVAAVSRGAHAPTVVRGPAGPLRSGAAHDLADLQPVTVTPPMPPPTGGAAARACSSVSNTAMEVPCESSRRIQ